MDTKNNGKENLIKQVENSYHKDCQIIKTTLNIKGKEVAIFYIESLINKLLFSTGILAPLERLVQDEMSRSDDSGQKNTQNNANNSENTKQTSSDDSLIQIIKNEIVSISSVKEESDADKILEDILSGFAVIVVDDNALCCPVYGVEKRGIQEPPTSRVVKGPREGFVEDIATNVGLVRKRIKTKNLRIIDINIGEQTQTKISLFYLQDIAKQDVVEDVKSRLKKIKIDGIIDSYYIESLLESNNFKFFRRVGNTEKPDVFCAKLLEGRVGMIIDGSPIALTVPYILLEDLQSPEDYYTIPAKATFTRIMRIIGLILSLLIPGIYVALQNYNYRLLPINFLITLLSSIEGLSVPPLIEILLVLLLFEIITEASLQMPNSLGMALSIIGALALGNTAVDAGIISPPSIVAVAVSSVSLYIIPDQISESRLLRILFTLLGGIVGLYGIVVGFIILTTHLCQIKSFGVPYLSPIAPSVKSDKKDSFIKQSIQEMKQRPVFFADKNKTRIANVGHQKTEQQERNETKNEDNQNHIKASQTDKLQKTNKKDIKILKKYCKNAKNNKLKEG